MLVTSSLGEIPLTLALVASLGVLFSAPLIFFGWKNAQLRRQHREGTRVALSEPILRPPGESLRVRADGMLDSLQREAQWFVVAALVGVLLVALAPHGSRAVMFFVALGLVATNTLRAAPKMLRVQRKLWDSRLSFMAERLVGEELNRMAADGYSVFHDIPCEAYNIDHVIVGPAGVFAVETQAHRQSAEVTTGPTRMRYDGDAIIWPDRRDTGAIDQALFNARSLAHWLSCSAGFPVKVQPIVTVPGWTVDDDDSHAVWVLNPTHIKDIVEKPRGGTLTPEEVSRLCRQLAQRAKL